ncbi:MAG: hypothetical protein EOO70_05365 [Myxococcaceae bacterium]|nr:MAG: hypothetical protein EOO70_05365 [Myxococcaceae bacterium]
MVERGSENDPIAGHRSRQKAVEVALPPEDHNGPVQRIQSPNSGREDLHHASLLTENGTSVPQSAPRLPHPYEEGDLDPGATIRKFRIVQTDGVRAGSAIPLRAAA